MLRMLVVLVTAIVVMVSTGFSATATTTQVEARQQKIRLAVLALPELSIIPGDSIGRWYLGMPLKRVLDILGHGRRYENPGQGTYTLSFRFRDHVSFDFRSDTNTVAGITLYKEGIGADIPASAFYRFFGQPDELIQVDFIGEVYHPGFIASWDAGITIWAMDSVVVRIGVFAAR